MSTMTERAAKVAEDLEGTCKELDDFASEEERDNEEFCRELDDRVFQCVTCGWWCPIDEIADNDSEEQVCTDCVEE